MVKLTRIAMFSIFILFGAFVSNTEASVNGGTTISIPSIGVHTYITNAPLSAQLGTWDVSHLSMNVGHLQHTAWFGQGSNVVLGGHSETPSFTPDIFYNLGGVSVNDIITVHTNGQELNYRVTQVRSVSQNDLSIIYPTGGEQLTIFTCQRDSFDSNNGAYYNRLVVIAVPA